MNVLLTSKLHIAYINYEILLEGELCLKVQNNSDKPLKKVFISWKSFLDETELFQKISILHLKLGKGYGDGGSPQFR